MGVSLLILAYKYLITSRYNWDISPGILEECFLELGIQFIPTIWGANKDFNSVYGNSPYLFTFNEPNFPDQSNLTPQQAAALWPQVQAVAAKYHPFNDRFNITLIVTRYNMKIASPSASYGGSNQPDAIKWLDDFFAACTGCQVDFINTHVSRA